MYYAAVEALLEGSLAAYRYVQLYGGPSALKDLEETTPGIFARIKLDLAQIEELVKKYREVLEWEKYFPSDSNDEQRFLSGSAPRALDALDSLCEEPGGGGWQIAIDQRCLRL